MLSIFCLRLASGMMATLLLVSSRQLNPRFFRAHFLTALGLTTVAALFAWDASDPQLVVALAAGMICAFVGSIVWSLDGAPGGPLMIGLTTGSLLSDLALVGRLANLELAWFPLLANEFTSAALLGTAFTAMLVGHSYLLAPTMSLQPLLRLLAGLLGAVLLRMVFAGWGLWSWTEHHSLATLTEVTMWLPVRWGLGFVGPLVLGVLAWRTARIRSTQSATGILYVVVILCFLGELTSQVLAGTTGWLL